MSSQTIGHGGIALQTSVPEPLGATADALVTLLPRLVGALFVLLVGWIIGRATFRVTRHVIDVVELDRAVLDTPLGDILGGDQDAVSRSFGVLAKWGVYIVAILTAADVLNVRLLSQWLTQVASYLPAFVGGLLVIVLGFVLADFVGDAITHTRAATETAYTAWFATGTRMFLYFTAIVVGLQTMGVNVDVLLLFSRAFAYGLGGAIALGGGIALGLGGKAHVDEVLGDTLGTQTPENATNVADD